MPTELHTATFIKKKSSENGGFRAWQISKIISLIDDPLSFSASNAQTFEQLEDLIDRFSETHSKDEIYTALEHNFLFCPEKVQSCFQTSYQINEFVNQFRILERLVNGLSQM